MARTAKDALVNATNPYCARWVSNPVRTYPPLLGVRTPGAKQDQVLISEAPSDSQSPSQGFGETHPHNPKVVSDMTALHHIHEASILYNLGERAKLDDQRPYTFMVRPTTAVLGRGKKRGGKGFG